MCEPALEGTWSCWVHYVPAGGSQRSCQCTGLVTLVTLVVSAVAVLVSACTVCVGCVLLAADAQVMGVYLQFKASLPLHGGDAYAAARSMSVASILILDTVVCKLGDYVSPAEEEAMYRAKISLDFSSPYVRGCELTQ